MGIKMTNQHPITPPPELVRQLLDDDDFPFRTGTHDLLSITKDRFNHVITQAARWGADQQLKHCADWLDGYESGGWAALQMCSDLRPKPPSLNSIALQMLGTIERDAHYLPEITDTIRRALEQLDD